MLHIRLLFEAALNLLQGQREVLPAFLMRDVVVGRVRENQCVVISGETGEFCPVNRS